MNSPEPTDVPPPEGGEVYDASEGRRYPRTIGGMFYLVILAGTALGIGIVWTGNWRLGTEWLAGALIVAAVVRLLLPRREAGMLAVRNRAFDCLLLAGVGVILIFLAVTIPNQPT
ncbi:MAG: putative integral rane protein [Nocardioides sp.]|nr:putative integral rane protein [Nocardioides sp.]